MDHRQVQVGEARPRAAARHAAIQVEAVQRLAEVAGDGCARIRHQIHKFRLDGGSDKDFESASGAEVVHWSCSSGTGGTALRQSPANKPGTYSSPSGRSEERRVGKEW